MRNLKKVLSLALALVMLLGMMVVGASAAEYKDASEIEYKTAADVLSAINVIQGRENGNFDPKAELNRAEGAAIIYRLIMGGIDKDPAAVSTGFTDVDGTGFASWASGYIAACAQQGILAGVGDNQFNPGGKLTGYAFAKMLLVALGYNADSQGYTGTGWEGSVFRDAYTRHINVEGVNMAANLTREQAAQMALQTLTATMVDQDASISVNGVVIPGDRATDRTSASKKNYDNDTEGDGFMQFCELYFSKLTLAVGKEDVFGRPQNEWKYNGDVIATAATATPVATYTSDMDTAAGRNQINNDLRNYTLSTSGDNALKQENVIEDGDPSGATVTAKTGANGIDKLTGNGKLVEVYATGKYISKIVVVKYRVGKLDVIERSNSTTYRLNGVSKVNNDTAENVIFNGEVADDDYVTYATIGNKWYVYPTKAVEGVMSAYRGNTITVEGETYTVATNVTGNNGALTIADFSNRLDATDTTYFIDQYGFVVAAEGTTAGAISDFAYIMLAEGTAPKGGINTSKFTLRARVALDDGTVDVYDLAVEEIDDQKEADGYTISGGTTHPAVGDYVIGTKEKCIVVWDASENSKDDDDKRNLAAGLNGKVFTYSLNSDDVMTLTVPDAVPSGNYTAGNYYLGNVDSNTPYKGGNTITVSDKDTRVNSSTVFVVIDGKKNTASTYNGKLPNVSETTKLESASVVVNAADATIGTARVVFTTNTEVGTEVAGEAGYAYVDKDTRTVRRVDGKTVYYYTGITNEGEIELTGEDSIKTGVYAYNDKDEIIGKVIDASKTSVIEDQIRSGEGDWLNLTDDTEYIFVDEGLSSADSTMSVVIPGTGNNKSNAAYVIVIRALSDDAAISAIKVGNESVDLNGMKITVTGTLPVTKTISVELSSEKAGFSIAKKDGTKEEPNGNGTITSANDTWTYKSGETADSTKFVITVTAENNSTVDYELTITSAAPSTPAE